MRTLGLIGGMSWEASLVYYRLINEAGRARLGGHTTIPSVLVTVEFGRMEALQRAGDWEAASAMVVEASEALARAGADCAVICANTMHVAAPQITALPVLHIGDATGAAIRAAGHDRALLLGTRYTMENVGGPPPAAITTTHPRTGSAAYGTPWPFLRDHLRSEHGIETDVPDADDRARLQAIIYEELTRGRVEDASRAAVERMCEGHDAVILGCTELTLFGLEGFDTTRLHAEAAVSFALEE